MRLLRAYGRGAEIDPLRVVASQGEGAESAYHTTCKVFVHLAQHGKLNWSHTCVGDIDCGGCLF